MTYFRYRTRENNSGTQRAQLVVSYTLPTATPTATEIGAGATPTFTPTGTPTPTGTATPTDTPTATPTSTPTAPPPPDPTRIIAWGLVNGQLTVTGLSASVDAGVLLVTVINTRTGEQVSTSPDPEGGFQATLGAAERDVLIIRVTAGGDTSEITVEVLPPAPELIAPLVDRTVVTTVFDATSFLYTGAMATQVGVAPSTIDARRVAVLRGQVRQGNGAPLSGVTVSVLQHPELGSTLTRADGSFDLVVNGGGALVVDYARTGFIRIQRSVDIPWQDYLWVPDVVMIPYDGQATVIDLTQTSTLKVARGTAPDGSRQATVLVPPNTSADLIVNGNPTPITTLTVRATEFTTDANGAAAMPGDLPPTSAYTYAVELSADEAITAGATAVRFNQPLFFYLENFLGFAVGSTVPAGYYDRARGRWVPADNGRVIKIMSVAGGLAELDTDGDGAVDNGTALGITVAERTALGGLYLPDRTLWRVPISHFTPWDYNWPYTVPDDAEEPKQDLAQENDPDEDDPDPECGSFMEAQNQVLGESLPLLGTPYRLPLSQSARPGRRRFPCDHSAQRRHGPCQSQAHRPERGRRRPPHQPNLLQRAQPRHHIYLGWARRL